MIKISAAGAARKRERARIGSFKSSKPVREVLYRGFVRGLPCCICYAAEWRGVIKHGNASDWDYLHYQASIAYTASKLQTTKTEAAHTGPHALGSKSSDRQTIPLCGNAHHREGNTSYHKLGEKPFEEHHGIDIAALIRVLNNEYDSGSLNTTARRER